MWCKRLYSSNSLIVKKYTPIHRVRVNSTANSSMNPLLLAVTVQIAKRFLLDYRFLSKPSFQTKFMETYHKVNRLEYIFDGVKWRRTHFLSLTQTKRVTSFLCTPIINKDNTPYVNIMMKEWRHVFFATGRSLLERSSRGCPICSPTFVEILRYFQNDVYLAIWLRLQYDVLQCIEI